ncbi:MAG: DUF2852 domain-containing protein [Alphaproteobacteria bacterium]|jgi:hypothetical protein|nr:DUF2852 domain-containing protein [Alphaproteobacteria bacterium]
MTTLTAPSNWFRRAELWLDGFGKPGWIAAMVLGFILFWPIGLALLAYMIWGKNMFTSSCKTSKRLNGVHASSGNTAFDAYKADTLRRLEDEQADFDAFLGRLRAAKDKAEFDAFMSENRKQRDADEQDTRKDA